MSWDTSKKVMAIGLSALITTAGAEPLTTVKPKSLEYLNKVASTYSNQDDSWDNIDRLNHSDNIDQNVVIDTRDIVNSVKVGLGLPDKDIAEIFQVSRQSIHTYRTQEPSSINLKEHTRQRANELFKIINKLNKVLDRSPGPAAKNIHVNDTTLFELLCQNNLDPQKILNTAHKLSEKLIQDRQAPHDNRGSISERKRTLHGLTKNT